MQYVGNIAVMRAVAFLTALALAQSGLAQEQARNITALNVSISVFESGVPEDQSTHRDLAVFPRIRQIEANFFPFALREAIVNTGEWGVVRVVPKPDEAAELMVLGTILRSDGEILELQVRVVDASGRVWFDRPFVGAVTGSSNMDDDIANELLRSREQLDDKALTHVVAISLLRYASQLAPSVFRGYLQEDDDGSYTLVRLPAINDPLLVRIDRIRSTEDVISDAVDSKFRELYGEIRSVYEIWREYRRKVLNYQAQDAAYAASTIMSEPRGSYEALKNQYDNYKFDRVTAQEQDRLAVAFNNEIGPTVDAMEARVAELQEWVDLKFAEWESRLAVLIEAEADLVSGGS